MAHIFLINQVPLQPATYKFTEREESVQWHYQICGLLSPQVITIFFILSSLNDVFQLPRLCSVKQEYSLWKMNWKGCGRYNSVIYQEELRKTIKTQVRVAIFRPKFKCVTSRIHSRSANHSTAMFSHKFFFMLLKCDYRTRWITL